MLSMKIVVQLDIYSTMELHTYQLEILMERICEDVPKELGPKPTTLKDYDKLHY